MPTKRAVTNDGHQVKWGTLFERMIPTSPLMLAPKTRGINMFTPQLGRYIKGVEYASMTSLLQDFRRQLEHEYGRPIHELAEANAAELISDLCIFLGLSDQNRRKVLGARAATYLDQTLTAQAQAILKH
jgi:hypothetical protein